MKQMAVTAQHAGFQNIPESQSTLERLRRQDDALKRAAPHEIRPDFDERLAVYRGFLKIATLFVAHIAVLLLFLVWLYV